MVCVICKKEFYEDWRVRKRKKELKFCSIECSRSRKMSTAGKKRMKKKLRKLWKNEEFKEKFKQSRIKAGCNGWSKKSQINGGKATALKAKIINEKNLQEGKYELLPNKVRRKILLEEANYTCESCHNSTWLGKPIWLEVHHKDNNKKHNKGII
jgi:hypothetical protein